MTVERSTTFVHTERSKEALTAFLSYSRLDKPFARRLVDALEQQHYSIWFDYNDIFPAGEFGEDIEAGIQEAGAFICLLSPNFLESNWCRKELKLAVEYKKKLVPVLYRAVKRDQAPPSLKDLEWIEDDSSSEAPSPEMVRKMLKVLQMEQDDWNQAGRWLRNGIEWEKDQFVI